MPTSITSIDIRIPRCHLGDEALHREIRAAAQRIYDRHVQNSAWDCSAEICSGDAGAQPVSTYVVSTSVTCDGEEIGEDAALTQLLVDALTESWRASPLFQRVA